MIRGLLNNCPFGLPIPSGCKCAGGLANGTDIMAIEIMTPVDHSDDPDDSLSENLELLSDISHPKKCPYLDNIFSDSKKVDCKYGDNKSIVSNQLPLNGSPEYPSIMIGNSSIPGFGQPPHDYSDNNNVAVYYGIYSLIS